MCNFSRVIDGKSSLSVPSFLPPPSQAMRRSRRANELIKVLDLFPRVEHAFAYGSGIFVQPGLYAVDSKVKGPMLDFIFAVNSPEEWHEQPSFRSLFESIPKDSVRVQNIQLNRHHYSSLAMFGSRAVTCNAERLGAGVHFNTAVPWGSQVIKYGVIRKGNLCRDLELWDTLYTAGRLQKPVLPLREDADVRGAIRVNRLHALAFSLLLLPNQFSAEDLGKRIVGLSYLGDIRMGIAEDSRKIDRIASGSARGIKTIYQPLLEEEQFARQAGVSQLDQDLWQQDISEGVQGALISSLPLTVLKQLAKQLGRREDEDPGNIAEAALASGKAQQQLQAAVASIVGPSSRRQAVAGALMAGPTRSIAYVFEKIKKRWT